MGCKHLSLMEKNPRTALIIEDMYFEKFNERLSFGEILDKHAIVGQSVPTVAENLKKLLDKNIKLLPTTLGGIIRLIIKQGKTNFRIAARVPNNPYRKKGSGRPPGKRNKIVDCKIYCECNNVYHDQLKFVELSKKQGTVGIETYTCKKCGKQGKITAKFISPITKELVTAKMSESILKGIMEEKHLQET